MGKYFCIGRKEEGVNKHPFLIGDDKSVFVFDDEQKARDKMEEISKENSNDNFSYLLITFDTLPTYDNLTV